MKNMKKKHKLLEDMMWGPRTLNIIMQTKIIQSSVVGLFSPIQPSLTVTKTQTL